MPETSTQAYRQQRWAAYGEAKVKELRLRPRSNAHAERIASKAVREVREEERAQ